MASDEQLWPSLWTLLDETMNGSDNLVELQSVGIEELSALAATPHSHCDLTKSLEEPHTERKRQRTSRQDPNRARNARGREVCELKSEIEVLTEVLEKLRIQAREHGVKLISAAPDASQQGGDTANVWKEIIHSQLSQRMRAETENAHLRLTLSSLVGIARRIQQTAAKSAQSMLIHGVRGDLSSRVQALLLDSETDAKRFETMLQEVDAAYNEVDAVLCLNGLLGEGDEPRSGVRMREGTHGRYVDMYAENILPFPLDATSKVIWEFYRGPAKHRGQLYFKTAKTISTCHETVIEKFALEQHANTSKVDFRFWQVLRRHVENGRVLVPWMGIAEPVEFTHKRVSSCGYIQKGYISCESLGGQFTRLRRCHRITPYIPHDAASSLRKNEEREISAIIQWNLRLDAVHAHLRYFENELLRESLHQESGEVVNRVGPDAWWATL